jgi:hypothetical protein
MNADRDGSGDGGWMGMGADVGGMGTADASACAGGWDSLPVRCFVLPLAGDDFEEVPVFWSAYGGLAVFFGFFEHFYVEGT